MSQRKLKERYDTAKEVKFEIGDQVLVLTPVLSGKLEAQWTGPYLVTEKLSPVTYGIDMHDRQKRVRTVTMMRKWKSPEATAFVKISPMWM